jgi:hypothetical protein
MVNRKNLMYENRLGLLHFLLNCCHNGTLERGALARAADFLSVVRGTVSQLWNGWVRKQANSLNGEWDVTSGKKNNRGPVKYVPEEFVNALADLPLRSKTTVRSLARLLGVSQGKSHHLIKLHCRRHSRGIQC